MRRDEKGCEGMRRDEKGCEVFGRGTVGQKRKR